MGVGLFWAKEDAAYIRPRSTRYPGALDIQPEWTVEVLADERLLHLTPYPTPRVAATGLIRFSPSAGRDGSSWSSRTATSTQTFTA
jgi:hypothetical protein